MPLDNEWCYKGLNSLGMQRTMVNSPQNAVLAESSIVRSIQQSILTTILIYCTLRVGLMTVVCECIRGVPTKGYMFVPQKQDN